MGSPGGALGETFGSREVETLGESWEPLATLGEPWGIFGTPYGRLWKVIFNLTSDGHEDLLSCAANKRSSD